MKKYSIYLLFVLLVACGQGTVQKNVEIVFKGPLFRNQQLGNSYSMVMKNEESKLMQFPDSNMIKYHHQISDSADFHWAYVFNNDRLTQIHLESFLGSPENAGKYIEEIKNKYNKVLGPSVLKDNMFRWENDSVIAVLFNESKDANMGYIRMVFYTSDDSTMVIPNVEK